MSTWVFSIKINGSTFVYEVEATTEEVAPKVKKAPKAKKEDTQE